ncbi:MAG TPA: HAMP domain-containing histidine kinase [Desulfuromonadales bacterium]|nr:HAMP domain-containing histidine kinase [Desulfuromonadales bacterium]
MNINGTYSFEQLLRLNRANNQAFYLSGFSHLLNNPLNSIHLASDLLKNYTQDINALFEELSDDAEQIPAGFREAGLAVLGDMPPVIQGISDSAFRLNQFVSHLAELTGRGATAASRDVDLNRLISLCASMAHHQICVHTSSFCLDLEPDLPVLAGNAEQMQQLILNLLMNALISLPDRSCAVVLSTSYNRATDSVQMRVQDEGVGISTDILPDILKPFFSTWSEYGCMGLGLNVADQIIRDHGGELAIDSELGKGTTMIVTFYRSHIKLGELDIL